MPAICVLFQAAVVLGVVAAIHHGEQSVSLSSSSSLAKSGHGIKPLDLPSVFVFFPGLGTRDRIKWVKSNLDLLKSELGNNFPCLIRVYADGGETDPHFRASEFAPCKVDYYEGMEMFYSIKTGFDLEAADNVFLLTDDMRRQANTLHSLRIVMEFESLSVVSASYQDAWCPYMKARHGHLAHKSGAVEFNAVLFKKSAFECLQTNIDAAVNPLGWGYTEMYSTL